MNQNQPTAAVITLGCKVNQYESEVIAERLKQEGFRIVSAGEHADVTIVNTCTVTAESDRKGCQMIRRAVSGGSAVLVTGCMAQTQPERVAAIPGVRYVCGSRNKLSCVDMAQKLIGETVTDDTVLSPVVAVYDTACMKPEPMSLSHSGMERTRAYIKIEDGCENRCTYCAIPRARGDVASKPSADVIAEVGVLLANGYHEIVLTGIEIASYGKDSPENRTLIDLLEALERAYPDADVRYRLGSLEPTYMKPDVVHRMASLPHLAHHFHLSLQSGADHVLREMKRKYNMDTVRRILADIRAAMPDVMFTTDIMAGFPGETEEDHAETMAFAKEAQLLHIHVFPYSRRKNTPADTYPNQLPNEEKNRRANELIALQRDIEASVYRRAGDAGGEVLFLAETEEDGVTVGHTANFMEVRVITPEKPVRCLRRVRITGAKETYLTAEYIR